MLRMTVIAPRVRLHQPQSVPFIPFGINKLVQMMERTMHGQPLVELKTNGVVLLVGVKGRCKRKL